MAGHRTGDRAALTAAVALTGVVMLLEVAGGYVSGSLALLSDAGHMLRDVLALLLSLGAVIIAERLPTKTRTFGYHRVEVLVAFVNGLLLIVLAGAILWEAAQRLSTPVAVGGTVMGAVGAVGLAANIAVAYILHGRDDLNVRSAFLHVLGDTLSSVAVIAAALWIALTGQTFVDPLLSGAIAVVILASSYPLLRETVAVLLQYTPSGLDFDEVVRAIEGVDGVKNVHNIPSLEPLLPYLHPGRPCGGLCIRLRGDPGDHTGDPAPPPRLRRKVQHPGVRGRTLPRMR
jgi:cobalt-zinc-cadmium efflux system protein